MALMYTIVYHLLVVRRDIPALSPHWKERIRRSIESKLLTAPEVFGKPLRRSLKNYRKLRIGDYRVVFRIEKKSVIVVAILHRSVVYGNIETRMS